MFNESQQMIQKAVAEVVTDGRLIAEVAQDYQISTRLLYRLVKNSKDGKIEKTLLKSRYNHLNQRMNIVKSQLDAIA